jgi:hypothetical protein
MHDRLTALIATRPGAMTVPVTRGQAGLTYAVMLAALDGRPGPAPGGHSL